MATTAWAQATPCGTHQAQMEIGAGLLRRTRGEVAAVAELGSTLGGRDSSSEVREREEHQGRTWRQCWLSSRLLLA